MFNIKEGSRSKIPKIPFEKIKDFILGQGYELSLVFVGDKLSRQLNKRFRNKDCATNILSFPYSKTDGEIFIDPNVVKKEAKREGEKYHSYLAYIFIHGLIHLKGFDHSSKMESKEAGARAFFKI